MKEKNCSADSPVSDELKNPCIVDFPLRGEWFAVTTPVKQIPSHGTDWFGQRYAYDFMMLKGKGKNAKFFEESAWKYYLTGIPLKNCFGWGECIFAPFDGVVVDAADGFKERKRIRFVTEIFALLKNSLFFNPATKGIQRIAGNYVILRKDNAYALFAHLQKDSVLVHQGQTVKKGEPLGRVGHSGNSTAPHLHFQLMDQPDPFTAKGIPCAFYTYEMFKNDGWIAIQDGFPGHTAKIRSTKHQ